MIRGHASFARQMGFTLMELIVVMMIITILAGAVTLQVVNRVQNARRARALQDIAVLESALDMYAADNGRPPSTEQGLAALVGKPSSAPLPRNWDGPYIKKGIPVDPWGNEYIYQYPGQLNPGSYDLISYGADGRPGGDDADADMTNSDEE